MMEMTKANAPEERVTTGDVSLDRQVINVTTKLNYTLPYLGGFTIAETSYVFAARYSENSTQGCDRGKLCKITISGSTLNQSPEEYLGHGNDVAYYTNAYYVAMGNAGDKNNEKRIQQFSSALQVSKIFSFDALNGTVNNLSPLEYISIISHYSGTEFILESGMQCSLCKLDSASLKFKEISRFKLGGLDSINRNGFERSGQGIFYQNGKLYKIFSFSKNGNPYKHNSIAVYNISRSGDVLVPTLVAVYKCDASEATGVDMNLFELEGIATYNSKFYVAVNQRDTNDNACDAIYQISF